MIFRNTIRSETKLEMEFTTNKIYDIFDIIQINIKIMMHISYHIHLEIAHIMVRGYLL
jgi:hypothetical protein